MRKSLFCVVIVLLLKRENTRAQFQQSNLPIFIINTNGGTIEDDPKIMVDLKVFYHSDGGINSITDEDIHFDGKAGIEFRGTYSLRYPKKSYSVELADQDGEELKFPLLGLPSEADWTLIANYEDRSALKNAYVYNLWAQTGRYSPRTMHVEVIINDEYMGMYLLAEKIKRDSKRIDIKKLEEKDTSLPAITGGYIIEAARETLLIEGDYIWQSEYESSPESPYYMNFECVYPKEPIPAQFNYIKKYIRDFETNLKGPDFRDRDSGFRYYIDEDSFVDNFVIQEYSIHFDIFARSQFFYKDRGKKMMASPLWDASSGLYEYYTDAWRFSCSNCDPRFFWVERLMEDCDFKNKVIEQYKAFRRTFLTYEKSTHYVDSVASVIQDAAARDRDKWHSTAEGTFLDDVQKLKDFIYSRLNWVDNNIHSIKEAGSELSSSANNADMSQGITLSSTCPEDSPVLWTYDTADGETGTFVGASIENVVITKTIRYYAKCQTTCPIFTNSVKISLNNNCPDNVTIETSAVYPKTQNFRSRYSLTSGVPVSAGNKTTYLSGNSILLTAGFKVSSQEVFVAEIEGCD